MPTKKPVIQTVIDEEIYKKFKTICEKEDRTESKMAAINSFRVIMSISFVKVFRIPWLSIVSDRLNLLLYYYIIKSLACQMMHRFRRYILRSTFQNNHSGCFDHWVRIPPIKSLQNKKAPFLWHLRQSRCHSYIRRWRVILPCSDIDFVSDMRFARLKLEGRI